MDSGSSRNALLALLGELIVVLVLRLVDVMVELTAVLADVVVADVLVGVVVAALVSSEDVGSRPHAESASGAARTKAIPNLACERVFSIGAAYQWGLRCDLRPGVNNVLSNG